MGSKNNEQTFTLNIQGQEVKVTLPPLEYKKYQRPCAISDETLRSKIVYLAIDDVSKATLSDYNEFKNLVTVEAISNKEPVQQGLFAGTFIEYHIGSVEMGSELPRDTKINWLGDGEQNTLPQHLGHKGLYVEMADARWKCNTIYVKMLNKDEGEFMGQRIRLKSLGEVVNFLCIQCREDDKEFMCVGKR